MKEGEEMRPGDLASADASQAGGLASADECEAKRLQPDWFAGLSPDERAAAALYGEGGGGRPTWWALEGSVREWWIEKARR